MATRPGLGSASFQIGSRKANNGESVRVSSPENKEAPNKSETKPKRGVTEKTAKNLGRTAVKGSNKGLRG